MIRIRPAEERGRLRQAPLDSRHSFSFGDYVDRSWHHFRALRMINEDRLAPGGGYPPHGHRDMELVTWVISGCLVHRDSMDHETILRAGEAQVMTAGIGIEHAEANPSATETAHCIHIGLFPEDTGGPADYHQVQVPAELRRNTLCLLASQEGAGGLLRWKQPGRLWIADLEAGRTLDHALPLNRHSWVHIAQGRLSLNGHALRAGDGAACSEEATLHFLAETDAQVLVIDLT